MSRSWTYFLWYWLKKLGPSWNKESLLKHAYACGFHIRVSPDTKTFGSIVCPNCSDLLKFYGQYPLECYSVCHPITRTTVSSLKDIWCLPKDWKLDRIPSAGISGCLFRIARKNRIEGFAIKLDVSSSRAYKRSNSKYETPNDCRLLMLSFLKHLNKKGKTFVQSY